MARHFETNYDTASVVAWLADGARSAPESQDVLAELCVRLRACGLPLWRVDVFVRTLHPEIKGRRFRWQEGHEVSVAIATFGPGRKSLVEHVCDSRKPIRERPTDDKSQGEFPLLKKLWAEGVTELFATPLVFTTGDVHAAVWTTQQADGFTDEQIAGIEAVVKPLARVAEVRALQRTASNLLDTYVGSRTGKRILAGQIRRGHTELINAAIWLSDMRGFTSRSDQLPPQAMIDMLNRYFDCQVPSIIAHGGEVLKFMGDGLLAMFPIDSESLAMETCAEALAAGLETRARIAALNSRETDELQQIRFGLALHVGDVLYGNIGGGNRLDFTCIGPAVNLAARLEKIAAELGRTVVASSAFAAHFDSQLTSLGEFTVRGFGAQQTVFGLSDEA